MWPDNVFYCLDFSVSIKIYNHRVQPNSAWHREEGTLLGIVQALTVIYIYIYIYYCKSLDYA